MHVTLQKSAIAKQSSIQITGSKSESNRLLLLQALYPEFKLENVSNSDDSVLVQNALINASNEINIGHAGTAMRFLTAYFSVKEGSEIVLTGSDRMKERPIKILVDALISLNNLIKMVQFKQKPDLLYKRKKTYKILIILTQRFLNV